MKRLLAYTLTLLLSLAAYAQISINGRKVLYDSRTNTMLATIPQSAFNGNYRATIALDEGWKNLTVNGTSVRSTYTFSQVKPSKTYAITIQNSEGYYIMSNITFTFLPMVQVTGAFGYDYQEGTICLISPDDATTDTLAAKLKWRGGTTNAEGKHKRNYKIKLADDRPLLGLRTDNNWILDAGQADLFRVRNRIATEIWNDMAHKPYYADQEPNAMSGVRGEMVEVFLNKEYQGIYCLTECMDRKQMKLKKSNQETGELHGGLWKAKGYGASLMLNTPPAYDNHSKTWDTFEMKYPDLDDVEEGDWSTLWNAINFVANSSNEEFSQQVADYFDIPVVIDYYIFIQSLNALDNWGKNTYWAVYDMAEDKKITPAVWDLDATVGQQWLAKYREGYAGPWSPDYVKTSNVGLFTRLIDLNVDDFNRKVAIRYHELRQDVLNTDNVIQRYTTYFDQISLSGAAQREQDLWSEDSDIDGEELSFESEVYYISYWLARHLKYLDDNYFIVPEDIPTSINTISKGIENSPLYDIRGLRVNESSHPTKGIYIRNNKKYIIK